jgi:hypothetical protein
VHLLPVKRVRTFIKPPAYRLSLALKNDFLPSVLHPELTDWTSYGERGIGFHLPSWDYSPVLLLPQDSSPGTHKAHDCKKVGLQVEKSSVTRFEPATFRLAVMRPTTLGKMVVAFSRLRLSRLSKFDCTGSFKALVAEISAGEETTSPYAVSAT